MIKFAQILLLLIIVWSYGGGYIQPDGGYVESYTSSAAAGASGGIKPWEWMAPIIDIMENEKNKEVVECLSYY